MLEFEELKADVLIIGSGIAGLSAAINAKKEGCDVLLVSKAGIGRQSATYFSGAWFKYSAQKVTVPGYDSGQTRYIFDKKLVKLHLEQAKDSISMLGNLGVPMEQFGEWYLPPRTDDKESGAIVVESITGKLKDWKLRTLSNCFIVNLLVRGRQCFGAIGLNQKGDIVGIKSRCTILATGGGASLFEQSCSPRAMVGDGYAMALRAGIPLVNMEFIQFETGFSGMAFPWQQVSTPIKMIKGVRLVNEKGEDLVQKYLGIKWDQVSRFASFKFEESEKAIGLGMKEGPVYLDLTQISASDRDKMPSRMKAKLEKCSRDTKRFPVEVIPIGHTYLGGVKINEKAETELPGLYAAGEVVGLTYAGENSVNHLTRSLVMGLHAGQYAAQKSRFFKEETISLSEWEKELALIKDISERGGNKRSGDFRKKVREIINEHMSPVRNADSLNVGLEKLQEVKDGKARLGAENAPELKEAIEVENMALLAETILRAAAYRRESRGPHFREDYPDKDNLKWYKPVAVKFNRKNDSLQVGF